MLDEHLPISSRHPAKNVYRADGSRVKESILLHVCCCRQHAPGDEITWTEAVPSYDASLPWIAAGVDNTSTS